MINPYNEIQGALDILELPPYIKKKDIKAQYYFMAKKYHPDKNITSNKMEQINHAYKILIQYIDEFRYSFDENEISKQYSGVNYANKFKP